MSASLHPKTIRRGWQRKEKRDKLRARLAAAPAAARPAIEAKLRRTYAVGADVPVPTAQPADE